MSIVIELYAVLLNAWSLIGNVFIPIERDYFDNFVSFRASDLSFGQRRLIFPWQFEHPSSCRKCSTTDTCILAVPVIKCNIAGDSDDNGAYFSVHEQYRKRHFKRIACSWNFLLFRLSSAVLSLDCIRTHVLQTSRDWIRCDVACAKYIVLRSSSVSRVGRVKLFQISTFMHRILKLYFYLLVVLADAKLHHGL